MHTRLTRRLGVVSMLTLAVAACGSASSTGPKVGPVNLGELDPLSGMFAGVGHLFITGSELGVADINAHGGVLGQQVKQFSADDAGDAVDAVPAMRQLLTDNLTYMSGIISQEFGAIQPLVDSAKIVAFANIPSPQYDSLTDKYIFREIASDSLQGAAMAYYALQKGWTQCSVLFANDQASQGLVAPLVTAYTKHGGQIQDNEQIVPDASSYRTEIEKAFAKNPQCVFAQTDPTTTGTLFANLKELGHLNIPIIGSNEYENIDVAKAAGLPDFSQWATATVNASPGGQASDYFDSAYKTKFGAAATGASAFTYDGVIIGALAMNIAKTTDPTIWANSVLSVSDPAGNQCYNYSGCVSLVKKGDRINYQGASGPMEFNSHHSVSSGFNIVKFDTSGNEQTVFTIASSALLNY